MAETRPTGIASTRRFLKPNKVNIRPSNP